MAKQPPARASSPAPTRHPFLSLQDAAFRLGDRIVFKGLSWKFFRDEQWAIVGANGSGKSLLADGLRGRLPLVQGVLRYFFHPAPGLTPEESIGHVSFEDRKIDLHETVVQSRWNSLDEAGALSVHEFLSYERVMDVNPFEVTDRHVHARPAFERRRRRAISWLNIAPFLERRLLSLSNGESQRVQLARALCLPLRLLILDEPFVGLDTATRASFHALLERLMDTPLRLLLIVTRLDDLPRHVTHLLWVDHCEAVAFGLRADVLSRFNRGQRKIGASFSPTGLTTRTAQAQTPTEEPLVQLRNVQVRYGNAIILRNINWTIQRGESWALLGPNGSGKTTLLSLILGDHPQAYVNEVKVFGIRRGTGESIWDLKRRIGWVSPELHLHFPTAATCLEVVASGFEETMGVFQAPTLRQHRIANRWLRQFGLQNATDAPLFALSAGWQRVVLLARALVKDPDLLILDEPCQGLDPEHRDAFVQTVDRLIRRGHVSVIYVTHRQDEIPRSIRKFFRLTKGRQVHDG